MLPTNIPQLDSYQLKVVDKFDDVSVAFINSHKGDTEMMVKDIKGRDTGWLVNQRIWADKIIESLTYEIGLRQGKVSNTSYNVLKLNVSDVAFSVGDSFWAQIIYTVTVNVSSNKGWEKTYTGRESTVMIAPSFINKDSNETRAANETVMKLVYNMLSDKELIRELSK